MNRQEYRCDWYSLELPRDISSQQKRHTLLSDAPLDVAAFERAKYHILGLFKL